MKLISPGKLRDVPESTEQGAGSRKPQLWPEPESEPEHSGAGRASFSVDYCQLRGAAHCFW